jgi:uncharacterized membrane-anchored protein YitT (DUF2179 family)
MVRQVVCILVQNLCRQHKWPVYNVLLIFDYTVVLVLATFPVCFLNSLIQTIKNFYCLFVVFACQNDSYSFKGHVIVIDLFLKGSRFWE